MSNFDPKDQGTWPKTPDELATFIAKEVKRHKKLGNPLVKKIFKDVLKKANNEQDVRTFMLGYTAHDRGDIPAHFVRIA